MDMQTFTSIPALVSCSTARPALTRQNFSLNPSEPNLSGPAEFKLNPGKTKELHKDLLCSRKCY